MSNDYFNIQAVGPNDVVSITGTVTPDYSDIGQTLNYMFVLSLRPGATLTAYFLSIGTRPGVYSIYNVLYNGSPNFPNVFTPAAPVTCTFQIDVNTLTSSGNTIYSFFNYEYDATTTPGGPSIHNIASSGNIVSTISSARINSTKSQSISNFISGNTITYTVALNNYGSTTATNIIFTDTLPYGLTFVPGSLYQDSINLPLANPAKATLNNIVAMSTSTVVFDAVVSTTPTTTAISNSATVTFNYTIDPTTTPILTGSSSSNSNTVSAIYSIANVLSSKVVNTTLTSVGDVLTYTIPLNNRGNTTATNVTFIDTIPNGLVLVPGSFTQNGSPISGTPSPQGILLNNIGPNATNTIVYKVLVNTYPNSNPIVNSATATFNYISDPSTVPNTITIGSSYTNIVATTVPSEAYLGFSSINSKQIYATCSNIVTYTIIIPNSGNVTANNVTIQDTIPNGMSFVSNSFTLNGVTIPSVSPVAPSSVNIGNIPPGSIATVSFSCNVIC